MTSFRVRPRFKQLSTFTPDVLVDRFHRQLASCPTCLDGKVYKTHGLLWVKPEEQHYWSPQLQISFEPTDQGTWVRGMYGPHPSVWAAFVFGYSVTGLAMLFLGIYGWVRYSLGHSAWMLWAMPVGALVWLTMYLISQVGQKVGAEQTFTLHHFVEQVLDEKVHIS